MEDRNFLVAFWQFVTLKTGSIDRHGSHSSPENAPKSGPFEFATGVNLHNGTLAEDECGGVRAERVEDSEHH
jgi:hypothetical protein